ncbi:hypothetical protein EVAR_62562_1 [Eumeta japonica]|uniref:Uncharacterized protein n=1 Tax=Eumeta variegata TaxID=151549 RepID=A0A4C1YMM9_EUMVA|nr:hypothetical protein EVAR_62562_1 [Eumeta japonica]
MSRIMIGIDSGTEIAIMVDSVVRPVKKMRRLFDVHEGRGRELEYSVEIIDRRCTEFKRVRTSTKDDHRSGRPTTVVTEEMVKTVEEIILAGYRVYPTHVNEAACVGCANQTSSKHLPLVASGGGVGNQS